MKRNILNKLLLLFCLLALLGCAANKQMAVERKADTARAATVSPAAPLTKGSVIDNFKTDKINAVKLKQTAFNTFSGKATAKLTIDGKENNVTMNIRIRKGEGIWVAVTAVLGVEVARALVTPDSIRMMNRMESTYIKKPFDYIYQYTCSQVNYQTLESALIGNAIPELLTTDAMLKPESGDFVLSGNLQQLIYTLIIGSDLRVTQTKMSDANARQSLQLENAQFIQAGKHVIPSQIIVSTTDKDQSIKIDLHYIRTEFDQPVEFPFTIPTRFSPVN